MPDPIPGGLFSPVLGPQLGARADGLYADRPRGLGSPGAPGPVGVGEHFSPVGATGLRTQDDLSGVSRPDRGTESESRELVVGSGEQATLNRDAEWAARAQSLVGGWVRTKTESPGLDPTKKSERGAWGSDGSKVPKGTALLAVGATLSDGAVLCQWPQFGKPGSDVQYRPVWLHHYHLEPASEPKQVREAREGDRLAAQQDEEARTNTARREGATKQLGQIRNFDDGFYRAVGQSLEAQVPNQGDRGKVEVQGNLPVLRAGKVASASLSLRFRFEVERDEKGIKARVEVGVGILGEVDLYIFDAFIQAMLFGYVEAYGDNGTEVMKLLSLALYKTVYAQGYGGRKAAGLVWGDDFEGDVTKNMDGDDYAEAGLGGEVKAGFGTSNPVTGKKRSGELTVRHSEGTRYTQKDRDEEAEPTQVESTEITVELSIFDGWSGSLSVIWGSGDLDIELELAREAELSTQGQLLNESNLREVLIHWVGAAFGQIVGLLRGQSGYQSNVLQRKMGAMFSNIQNVAFGPLLGEAAVVHVLAKRFKALKGLKLAQQLAIGLEVENGRGQISAELSSLRAIEYGEERDGLHVLLESATRIANIESDSFAI